MDKQRYRIGFIGIGVLGKGLALSLSAHGYSVIAAHSRSNSSARWLADRLGALVIFPTAQDLVDSCDIVFITTPDSVIGETAASVRWRTGQAVVHCSGALSTEVLYPSRSQGAVTGGFHPFQTFAGMESPEDIGSRLTGVSFAVAGDEWLGEFLTNLAYDLGGHPVSIPDEGRPLYHASAILACGYLAALLNSAVGPWRTMGFTEEEALRALLPLATATLKNIEKHGIPTSVTGPVVRGDVDTVASHFEALLQDIPETVPVYRALTAASLGLAAQRGVPPQRLEQLKIMVRDSQWGCSPCLE